MAAADAEAPASPVAPVAASTAGALPDFAVVCSFLERYGTALDLPEITFPELEEALEETSAVAKPLMELHLKLMRKIGKSVTVERWEKYMVKICQDYNSTWAWEMEKKGYQEMSVECKVGLLKHLCECQFDDNLKFKNAINEEDGDAMRLQPIGKDKDGLMYWFQLDQDHNIRMYIEEQDDQDGSTWKCIARTRNDLAETLELLKAQIDPALLKKSEPQDESLKAEGDEMKPENEEGAVENGNLKEKKPEGEEKELEKPNTVCPGEDNELKLDGEKPLLTPSEIKTEPHSDTEEKEKEIAKDENDSVKENIKPVKVELQEDISELKDLKDSKVISERLTPLLEPERSEISVIVKRTEDPVEKPVEDTEKLKNDQQAKIPLKKRELKLTDDFDSPVKATLCKSVTPTKELLQKDEGKPEEDSIKTTVDNSTGSDGKQLVNGEVNSDKTHRLKVDQVENNGNNAREGVICSVKEENGILHEKRSVGVIKSLHNLKENSKLSSSENLEKSPDLGNDHITSSLEKSNQKVLSKEELRETDSNKTSAKDEETEKKKDIISVSNKERASVVKEASSKVESGAKQTKESAVIDQPEESSETKVSPTIADPCDTEQQPEQNLKSNSVTEKPTSDRTMDDSEDKPDSKLSVPVKTVKSQSSKRTAIVGKKSTLKAEVIIKSKEKKEEESKVEPETSTEKETKSLDTEKSSETEKKTSTSKNKHKDKLLPNESKQTDKANSVIESQLTEDGAATPEVEKSSKSEKQAPGLKSKHRSKLVPEDENSGTEGKEMTSERQKDGLKLTIRISSKRKRGDALFVASAVAEAEEPEAEESTGRTLRRSPRISRPSVKAVEVKERKPEKKPIDEEDKPTAQKAEKDEERKPEKEESVKIKKFKPRQRKRTRWTNFRSRRKRKCSSEEESEESDSEEDSEEASGDEEKKEEGVPGEDDEPCKKCGLPNHPELILLCDSCDSGYHTACLRPPLMIIPDGEWFCPPCQHKLLCDKLDEQLQNLDVVLKKKERAERRKERLVYVGISIENIIPTQQETEEVPEIQEKEEKKKKKPKPLERRSTRARKCISYRFDEFDEAIDEAIEDDIRDADESGGGGHGKDMSNITGHRGKDISTILEGERTESKRPQRTVTRRKKRRRLNDLDSDSNVEEEESEDDEFRISEGSQDEFVVSEENLEESEEDQQSNDSDFGVRKPRRHYRRPMRKSRRLKRRTTKRRYSDDDEEESEEEAGESETEASSDYSDDYLDTRRRRSRRNPKRQVNYKEETESDNSQKGARHGRGKEMRRVLKRRFSSSESNESDSSKGSVERQSNRGRKPLLRKRIRSSDDEGSEDDEEEERPVRKRLNRIETDDEDEEAVTKDSEAEKPPTEEKSSAPSTIQESTKKPSYRIESDEDDLIDNVGKDGSPLDYSLVDLPSTNGQSPGKTIENLIGKPSEKSETSKDTSTNISQASNGTSSNQEAVVPEEDEDELLRVTDLVDYVCNSEQL
ncbi:remodeling and spacing factor 1 isoform 1-T1 [Discoglossus pictus]